MPEFLVVGVYADADYQRFADTFTAHTAAEAERAAIKAADEEGGDLVVAAVFNKTKDGLVLVA
jgi:hypothetical protein